MVRKSILILAIILSIGAGLGGGYALLRHIGYTPPPPFVQYHLTIQSTTGGCMTQPGEGFFTYKAGSVVNLTAVPASGYRFSHWSGDAVGTSPTTAIIIMDSDKCAVANFELVILEDSFWLEPQSQNETSIEDLLSSLYGMGAIEDGHYCSRLFFLEAQKPVEIIIKQIIPEADSSMAGAYIDGLLFRGKSWAEAKSGDGTFPLNIGGAYRVNNPWEHIWEFILVFTPNNPGYFCLYLEKLPNNIPVECEFSVFEASDIIP
jgi:hypothetical protein